MVFWRKGFIVVSGGVILGMMLGLSACAHSPTPDAPTATIWSELTAFHSPTPSSSPPTQGLVKTKPPPPLPPTPTPITYTVIKGDTMLGLALRFGISLEEILAANPEVDPRFLSVDTVLIIPLGESSPIPLATSTPLPVITAEPVCYETTDRGAWCFLLVKNNLDDPLENVSARIYLVPGPRGETVERIAYTPLNLIPPEASLPVMVFFDPPLDRGYMPVAEIISALPANGLDERYVSANLKVTRVDVHQTGLKAVLEGVISVPKRSEPAALISLAAVAYGREKQVIGVRQVEINGPVDAGVDLPFTMEIFSLGPKIEQVEAFVEARPAGASSDVTPTGD